MSPHNHHTNDMYIAAYTQELSHELRTAWTTGGTKRSLRRGIARSIVRFGAWMLPDTPELVDGHILVLEVRSTETDHLKQAA
ncbi:MAG: hypothetical protein ACR2N2_06780 [Acidimicrobiia bacterium]